LGEHLHGVFAGEGSPYSTVALLDWTTIRHVHTLMTSDTKVLDMFVALADLNSLLAAALFMTAQLLSTTISTPPKSPNCSASQTCSSH
jgi:hypothetical protein